jgi:hypothetical protein
VEEQLYLRMGKGGRYGGGNVNWNKVQVLKNPDRKEIMVVYDIPEAPPVDPDPPPSRAYTFGGLR